MTKRRIGIFSGSFDPVHPGHIVFAEEARRTCVLNEVHFLPERHPRGKPNVTDIVHRVALLERATASMPGLSVANVSSARFTVRDTLPELRQLFSDANLTLLVGSDVVRSFATGWAGLEVLLAEVALAIGLRGNDTAVEMSTILQRLEQDYKMSINHHIIDTQHAHLSSSQVRGGAVDGIVWPNQAMADYIEQCGLYS